MVDGSALLTTMFHGLRASGQWHEERGTNAVQSGAHFYEVYETADGEHISLGAVERRFYAEALDVMNLASQDLPDQFDEAHWPEMKRLFSRVFLSASREEWCRRFEGRDACFAPVLSLADAPEYGANVDRGVFVSLGDCVQPAPAPRFSRTPAHIVRPPPLPGGNTDEILAEHGFARGSIAELKRRGIVTQSDSY